MFDKLIHIVYTILAKFNKGPYKIEKEVRVLKEDDLPPSVKARLAKKRAE